MAVRAVPKTARVSATERFHRSARRGPPPLVLLLGGITVAGVLAAGAVLFWPHDPGVEALDGKIDAEERRIAGLEAQVRLIEAAAALDRLAAEHGASDRYGPRASGWRTRARLDRELAADLKKADADFAAWKGRAERAQKEAVRAVWEEGIELKRRAGNAPVSWKTELDRLLADLEKRFATPSENWQAARERISKDCRLDHRGEADWARGLVLWQAYLAGSVGAADRSGAESALRSIHAKVREDFGTVRARVLRLDPAAAAAEVGKHRPRFKGTAAEADLEALLRQ